MAPSMATLGGGAALWYCQKPRCAYGLPVASRAVSTGTKTPGYLSRVVVKVAPLATLGLGVNVPRRPS